MFTNIVQQKYINIKLLCVKYIVRQNNIVSLTKSPDERSFLWFQTLLKSIDLNAFGLPIDWC